MIAHRALRLGRVAIARALFAAAPHLELFGEDLVFEGNMLLAPADEALDDTWPARSPFGQWARAMLEPRGVAFPVGRALVRLGWRVGILAQQAQELSDELSDAVYLEDAREEAP